MSVNRVKIMELQIKIKSGYSVVETVKLPNSSKEVEIAHSSIEDIIEKIKSSIEYDCREQLRVICNDETNYNKEFTISCQIEVSDKQ